VSEQEQRIAIAEWCGVECKRCYGKGKYLRYGNHEWFRIRLSQKNAPEEQPFVKCDHFTEDEHTPFKQLLPDYLHDLNAMHEAEKKLKTHCDLGEATDALIYRMLLKKVAGYGGAYTATANQRAEALLRMIGKWRDE
jgi:hypothetical protein